MNKSRVVVVLIANVGKEEVEGLQKSLDHWRHTAEAAYAAEIRLETVEPK